MVPELLMPIYEYRCEGCDKTFEILQRLGAGADDLECPHCAGRHLSKQFSTFAASTAPSSSAGAGGDCGAPGCGTGFT